MSAISLLRREFFEHVFMPLRGLRVGLVDGFGNVGDELIWIATRQLLDYYKIDWYAPPSDDDWNSRLRGVDGLREFDVLLLFGGGSMGSSYRRPRQLRERARATGRPCVVLPQSYMGFEDGPYERVYLREPRSRCFCPNGILAPDLALGLEVEPPKVDPKAVRGVFLRQDHESQVTGQSLGDPARQCCTPAEYLALAGQYEHVITDRLHFAIASLICGNRTTLLPCSYHKNRGMWEAWLGDIGCEWADEVGWAGR